jgi:DNA-binding transcriptional ArsR family regulator
MREMAEPGRADLRLADVLHALSDPTRLGIVRALAGGEKRACREFETELAKSSLTHHFRVLREAGVTHTRRDGRTHYLTLRRDDLEARFPGLLVAVVRAAGCDESIPVPKPAGTLP